MQKDSLGARFENVDEPSTGMVVNLCLEVFINTLAIYALVKCKPKLTNVVLFCPIFRIALGILLIPIAIIYEVPVLDEFLSRSFFDNVGCLLATDHLSFVLFLSSNLKINAWFCIPIFIWFYKTLYACQKKMSEVKESAVEYPATSKRNRRKDGKASKDREYRRKQKGPAESESTKLNSLGSFMSFLTALTSIKRSRETPSELNGESSRINQASTMPSKESTTIGIKNKEQSPLKISNERQLNTVQDLTYHASQYGHSNVVRDLLANHSLVINITLKEEVTGFTAFHMACAGGHLSVVQQLMKAYGNEVCIGLLNTDLKTGLELAAQYGRKDVVQAILSSIRKKHVR